MILEEFNSYLAASCYGVQRQELGGCINAENANLEFNGTTNSGSSPDGPVLAERLRKPTCSERPNSHLTVT